MIRSKKITQSARGETCAVRIVGRCNNNPDTTVLVHLPSNQHGMGIKSSDLCAVYGCSACHDIIDRRVIDNDEFEPRRSWYLLRAVVETHERMVEKGVLKVA